MEVGIDEDASITKNSNLSAKITHSDSIGTHSSILHELLDFGLIYLSWVIKDVNIYTTSISGVLK